MYMLQNMFITELNDYRFIFKVTECSKNFNKYIDVKILYLY